MTKYNWDVQDLIYRRNEVEKQLKLYEELLYLYNELIRNYDIKLKTKDIDIKSFNPSFEQDLKVYKKMC